MYHAPCKELEGGLSHGGPHNTVMGSSCRLQLTECPSLKHFQCVVQMCAISRTACPTHNKGAWSQPLTFAVSVGQKQ